MKHQLYEHITTSLHFATEEAQGLKVKKGENKETTIFINVNKRSIVLQNTNSDFSDTLNSISHVIGLEVIEKANKHFCSYIDGQ